MHQSPVSCFSMSRLYDAAEPTVIDEKLLRSLILEQGPDGEAGKIIEKEGAEFHEVLEIRIDFKSKSQKERFFVITGSIIDVYIECLWLPLYVVSVPWQ